MIIWIRERENPGQAIWEAIRRKPDGEPLELRFEPGDYFFRTEHAFLRGIYITNATTVPEGVPPMRQIGILIENASDVMLTGDHTTLWFDGRMSEIVIRQCNRITVQGFTLNFVHPSVFEFDLVRNNMLFIEIQPCEHCVYTLENGKLTFPLDSVTGQTIMQARDAKRGFTKRINTLSRRRGSAFSAQLSAKRLKNGRIRVMLPFSWFRRGLRYQLSNPFRDGVGTLIDRSNDITFRWNTVLYMHGLGITAQLSQNVSILDCDFLPDEARGITTCAAADMIHACMCTGLFEVRRCRFEGARDDVINVHGVHFRVVRVSGNEAVVMFCQHETYGFLAFDAGDIIEFVDPATLACIGEATVLAAEMVDGRRTRLTLDRTIDPRMRGGVIENITKTCDVMIDSIVCRHIPTRGVLVSTRGKVVICNSRFHALPMANVLIADDAHSWFESGRVSDVRIENNIFDRCGAYPVDIYPETFGCVRAAVHKNIRIIGNEFYLSGKKLVRVKDTEGFVFSGNQVHGKHPGRIRLQNVRTVKFF